MKPSTILKYAAAASRVITTIVLFLCVFCILQEIGIEISFQIEETLQERKYEIPQTRWPPPTRRPPSQKPEPLTLTEEEKQLFRIGFSQKEFLPDGTIHLICATRPVEIPGEILEPLKLQVHDVNDNLIWQGLPGDIPYKYLLAEDEPHPRFEDYQRRKFIDTSISVFSPMLDIFVQYSDKAICIWRYIPAKRYFIGYNSYGRRIGYIGLSGFVDSKSDAKPFGICEDFVSWHPKGCPDETLLLQAGNKIYEINFEEQQVQMLFDGAGVKITSFNTQQARLHRSDVTEITSIQYRPFIHCVTEDRKHHFLMRNPEQRLTITIPKNWESINKNPYYFIATDQGLYVRHGSIEYTPGRYGYGYPEENGYGYLVEKVYDWRAGPTFDGPVVFSIKQWSHILKGKTEKHWVELYKVDNEGNLEMLNRYDWIMPARPSPVRRAPKPKDFRTIKNFRTIMRHYVSQLSPPLYDLAWHTFGKRIVEDRMFINYPVYNVVRIIGWIRPGDGLLNWLLSLGMVAFAFWHGWPRRISRGGFIFWLVFVGAFNIAGLITYLALKHAPVIKCPVCNKRRGLNQINCIRCGADLPVPERTKHDLIFNT